MSIGVNCNVIMRLVVIVFVCLQYPNGGWGDENLVSEAPSIYVQPDAIGMPLGNIVLIRKNSRYCVLNFTKFIQGKKEDEGSTSYEAYFQGDGSGDFTKKNIKSMEGELSFMEPKQMGGILSVLFHPFAIGGGNRTIISGNFKLSWTGGPKWQWVYFYRFGIEEPRDHGIEIAPTAWGNIDEVNVFDTRLKWYRYDANRSNLVVPVDKLWEDNDKGGDTPAIIPPKHVFPAIQYDVATDSFDEKYNTVLEDVANILKKYTTFRVRVEGHSDMGGTEAYNLEISSRRARAVKEQLVKKYGIQSKRIEVVGWGTTRPIGPSSTANGRAANNRVEIKIAGVD